MKDADGAAGYEGNPSGEYGRVGWVQVGPGLDAVYFEFIYPEDVDQSSEVDDFTGQEISERDKGAGGDIEIGNPEDVVSKTAGKGQ